MKKSFFAIVALLALSFSMQAQNVQFNKDANLAFGNKVFVVEPVSYIGYGYHLKSNSMAPAQDAFNSEFFINIMELGIRPAKFFMISLGVDYDLDQYRLNKGHVWGEDADIMSLERAFFARKDYSRLNVHTFAIPLSLEFRAGKGAFRFGAAGEYNLPAVVKTKGVTPTGAVEKEKEKINAIKQFSYSLFGSISYGGLGVYARYTPNQLFNGNPQLQTFTIGAVIGMGM